MTDTLIKNSEIEIKDITANLLKVQMPANSETDGSFSALMTNAVNKAEQTQTNFVDTAVKSNTSSVNKYALESSQNNQKTQTQVKTKSNDSNRIQNQTTNTKQNIENVQNNKTIKQSSEQNALKTTNNQTVSRDEKVNNDQKTTSFSQSPVSNNQSSISVDDKADMSPQNINNNSLESSPVSLGSSETNEQTNIAVDVVNVEIDDTIAQTQEEIKALVENILLTFDIPVNTNEDSAIDTEEIFNIADSTEDNYSSIVKAIEEVSSQVNDMDLSQDSKDKLQMAFDKVKETTSKLQYNLESDNTIKEAKNLLDNLLTKVSSTDSDETGTVELKTENTDSDIKIDIKDEGIENLKSEIEKLIKAVDIKDDKKIQETIKEVKKAVVEVKEEIADKKEITENDEKLAKLLDKLSEKIDDNKVEIKEVKEFSDTLKKEVEPKKTQEVKVAPDTKVETKDTNKADVLKAEVTFELKEETDSNFENLKINDNDTVSQIIDKLKEFEKTEEYQKLDDSDKIKIQKLAEKLSELKDDVKPENNKQVVEELKKEVAVIIDNETEKTDNTVKAAENTQTQVHTQKPESTANNYNFSKNDSENKSDYQKEDVKISSTKTSDFNTEEIDENEDVDLEIDTQNEEIEIVQKSDNQSKSNLIDKLKDDFMESIEYEESAPIVISVADEVVKFALSENNSLPVQPVAGSITYDPANSAIPMRNVQNIAQYQQVQETSETNILNQIGDKLTQLKDSQKLTIVLRPDDLGRLSIELTQDKNGITTSIIAQNETVRNYIEKNINALRVQLSEAGVNVNSIQIKTSGQDGTTTYEGNQNKNLAQENEQKQDQNPEQRQNQKQKENLAHLRNYDMHFAKDFAGVLDKTLSYMN